MINSDLNQSIKLKGISACVFDAYGTLFDVDSVARGVQEVLGERWQVLSNMWREKQLQYTWLRSLAGHHADFWRVTSDALDYAMTALCLEDRMLHERLMNMYLSISAFPEVPKVLSSLKSRGMKLAVLSNGTPKMLASAIKNSGIKIYFDEVLSVEQVGVFKPHPDVYGLALRRLRVSKDGVCFLSSNSWDAYCAKAFGFRVIWCNRFGQAPERIPSAPDGEIIDLSILPETILV